MKLLLERVRQAGASNSRVAGVIILLAFLIFSALFAARTPALKNSSVQAAKPAIAISSASCTASTIFSASFTHGQNPSPEVAQKWIDFIQSLTPAGYDTVTISETSDSVGRTLTDATIVPQIAAALQGGNGGSWPAGNLTWNVGVNCGSSTFTTTPVELNANSGNDSGVCPVEAQTGDRL